VHCGGKSALLKGCLPAAPATLSCRIRRQTATVYDVGVLTGKRWTDTLRLKPFGVDLLQQ
jgi:hypothetical protein